MTESDLDRYIEHWARWHREGRLNRRCESAEGVYTDPQGKGYPTGWGDWMGYVGKKPGSLDLKVAQMVEDSWVRLSHKHKLLLKLHYIFKLLHYKICREIGIKPNDYGINLISARHQLALDIERTVLQNDINSESRTRVSSCLEVGA